MASKRRQLYVLALQPSPPPKYRAGEAGPPIPGLGQVQQERIRRANEAWLAAHAPTNEGASRPVGPASPRQRPPRNRRYSRRAPGDRYTGSGRRPNQYL